MPCGRWGCRARAPGRRLRGGLAAAVILAGTAAGCGNTTIVKTVTSPSTRGAPAGRPSSTSAATGRGSSSRSPAHVGETLTLVGQETTLKVRVSSVLDPLTTGAYDSPASGKRYIGVQLVVKNVGDHTYSDSVSNGSTVVLKGDQQADSTIVSDGPCGGGFGSDVKIAPGDTRAGCIPFEVPSGVRLRSFQFTPDSGFSDETGEWNISSASSAPSATAPSGPDTTPAPSSGDSAYMQCDANIAAKAGTTDCSFAQNTFYEYWSHHGGSSFSVYSASTGNSYATQCASDGSEVTCTTDQGGGARFPQSAIDSYSQSQADQYAATHRVRP